MNDREINKLKEISKSLVKNFKKKYKYDAEVSSGTGWGSEVSFEQGKLKKIKSGQTSSIALRVLYEGKIGVSGTNNPEKREIHDVLKDAIEVSEFGKRVNFKLPDKVEGKKTPKIYDPDVVKLREEDLVQVGREIIEIISSKEPDFKVNSLSFSKGYGEGFFANTKGIEDGHKATSISFSMEISKIKQGDFLQLYSGQTSVKADIDYLKLSEDLLKKVIWSKNISEISSGKYPVIFSPEAVSDLVALLLIALNGKSVNEGTSKLKGKIGSRLFDPKFSLIDDPTLDYFPSSYTLDDEGVVARRKYFIDKGVVKTFYYDLAEAAKAGMQSTGNGGKAGMFGQVSPTSSSILVVKGDKPFNKLVKNIKQGLLVYQFLGSGQNNPYNGDFQLGLFMGYKIERGEVVGRLKDTAISGNVYDLLRDKLLWLSKEHERWGSLDTPYICLDNVMVLTK